MNKLPPLDGGTYMAICVGVIDVGEQYSSTFKNYSNKLILIFEIPSETIEIDGEQKPRWLSKDYSASLSEKSILYKTLVSWRGSNFTEAELAEDGTGFDLTSMAGKPCMLTVVVEEKDNEKFNKITQVAGMPKGIPAPVTESEILIFDIDNRNQEVFDKLPEWIQERIKKSTQYQQDLPDKEVETAATGTPTTEAAKPSEPLKQGGDCPI